ncbi:MAG: hypothetical protein IIV23_04185 [Ruminococcus sp.]|nr:hypothetical protein [Ruminococcus sp.]
MAYKYRKPVRVSEDVLHFDPEIIRRQFPETTNSRNYSIMVNAFRRSIAEDLTDRQRTELIMYMHGNTMPAIAAELGIDTSTVSRTLARAKQRIRKALRFYIEYSRTNFREEDDA